MCIEDAFAMIAVVNGDIGEGLRVAISGCWVSHVHLTHVVTYLFMSGLCRLCVTLHKARSLFPTSAIVYTVEEAIVESLVVCWCL